MASSSTRSTDRCSSARPRTPKNLRVAASLDAALALAEQLAGEVLRSPDAPPFGDL
jgi:hypothetical protein